ncbi:MAG: polysaccharide pyruvyl transferase family protein [Clostridia bacterium]|nr:polysaccharide pyruvyl transferase family protein [Clostridia bacterium]
MKKIGVLTHYYDSLNYGGNLQAFALSKFLINKGLNCEQISFIKGNNAINPSKRLNVKRLIRIPLALVRKFISKKHNLPQAKRVAFENFNKNVISHSEKIYGKENIKNCVDDYDTFITGSDQVWNFAWYNPEFFLDFVPSSKKKISYSASIGRDSLTEEQKEVFKNSLKDFDAVSVREPSSINLIEDLSPVPVVSTLDPTLILEREDWDKVSSKRLIKEDYIFCYFLGNYKKTRKLVNEFAKKYGLKIACIPYTAGIVLSDRKFGDYRLIDASPEDFISLIKHAKYIFTDSFHAVVFSHIYKKEFFVFNRDEKALMSGRIKDITSLFACPERYCGTSDKMTLQYIEGLPALDYSRETEEFVNKKRESIEFLENNLKD